MPERTMRIFWAKRFKATTASPDARAQTDSAHTVLEDIAKLMRRSPNAYRLTHR